MTNIVRVRMLGRSSWTELMSITNAHLFLERLNINMHVFTNINREEVKYEGAEVRYRAYNSGKTRMREIKI